MTAAVILAAALIAAGVAMHFLGEPGPHPVIVLARRYGLWAFAAPAAAVVLLMLAAIAPAAGAATVAASAAVAGGVAVGMQWGPRTAWRAARRITLRCRWTSVARATSAKGNLTPVERRRTGIGADSAERWRVVELEWTPSLHRGRALPGGVGCVWQLRPARGSSLPEIADRATALAAGLHVAQVQIETVRPDLGRLVVIWR